MQRQKKIVCIAQIYNEIEKGNLQRFLTYVKPLVDVVVFYDDGSTDGSYEYVLKHTPHVIRGKKNAFAEEIAHKQLLLNKAKELGADFILWLDADEVVSNTTRYTLEKLCSYMQKKNIDGLSMHEINLWRSSTWARTDSLYNIGWFVRLWRITPKTAFSSNKKGLHKENYPPTLKKIEKTEEISVIHYGFSSEKSLTYKYLTYKSYGQKGYVTLDRLISEETLALQHVPQSLFPHNLYHKNEPKPKKRKFTTSLAMVENYKPQALRPKYSIVCLIYKSTEWLIFVYQQILRYTDMKDVEFFFVANDATPEVLEYLKNNYIPHYVWNNTEKQKKEWYINNVYRAWNFGAKKAKGDFIIFVNSDMAFTSNWLENLIKYYNGKNCITSRLVESGKMKSGLYGVGKNFGRTILTYQEDVFQKYVKTIQKEELKKSGLFMPLFIRKDHFFSVVGYPEGNIVPSSNIFKPKIAKQGKACISGDRILMKKLETKGIIHQTAFDSIVYHFQEGEMDSAERKIGEKQIKNIKILVPEFASVLHKFPFIEIGEKNRNARIVTSKTTKIVLQTIKKRKILFPDVYTVFYLSQKIIKEEKFSDIEKLLHQANLLVTDSFAVMSMYRDYLFAYLPNDKESQKVFWLNIFTNISTTIAQKEALGITNESLKTRRREFFKEQVKIKLEKIIQNISPKSVARKIYHFIKRNIFQHIV